MAEPLNVLIVEDSEEDVELLMLELRRGGFAPNVKVVSTEDALAQALADSDWDLVLSDYAMPNFDGLQCLAVCREHRPDVPFILVSGAVGEEVAVDAMRAGAHDYVMKGRLNRLVPAIKRELEDAVHRREHKRLSAYIEYIAYHDPVTELPNERAFRRTLQDVLAEGREEGRVVVVVVLEIGNLRVVRDVLGADTSHSLMNAIAARLKRELVDARGLGQLDESSFGIILELAGVGELAAVDSQFAELFDDAVTLGPSHIHVDPHSGIAISPVGGGRADALLQNAYVAAFQAAKSGVVLRHYSQEEDRATPQRLALLGDLHAAIRSDDLMLHYQPIVDLATGAIVGVEGLVRWDHPKYGLVMPGMFLEGAEQSGLIRPLTYWGIRKSFGQVVDWEAKGIAVPVCVNLSVRMLEDKELGDYVRARLDESRIDPRYIGFEVTESAVLRDDQAANRTLNELHEMGFPIAIDDFGTGYSSLRYIHQLPIDSIKLDRSFITDLDPTGEEHVIVKAIVGLATDLGYRVVAEGVERAATMRVLRDIGCHHAQGYLFSRAVPADRIESWLLRGGRLPWEAQTFGLRQAAQER